MASHNFDCDQYIISKNIKLCLFSDLVANSTPLETDAFTIQYKLIIWKN